MTCLDLDIEEAGKCWFEIIDHYESLCVSTGRRISLTTAICDYFCSVHQSLKNPKVVELHIFEKTIRESNYDSLTGLFNRRYFDEAIERELSLAKRHNTELSLLFFDLDDFKEINDDYGHQAGDAVLKTVAKIIQEGRGGKKYLPTKLPQLN